jgi:hypothetical protein
MYTQKCKVNQFHLQKSSRNLNKTDGMSYTLSHDFSQEVEYSNTLCNAKTYNSSKPTQTSRTVKPL